ncbi:TIR domain-containing protein [Enterococcus diestrammenae]|uniref:Thoeris protein ThsB TIR-like domain-containing protein n=1 Tax=Enterococcus diestrammenae TaxID=1155073 RepID=A0ABV0F3B4_9ENTE
MGHKCFISFKSQDMEYKKYIQEELEVDMIDKSLNEPINSEDEEYIMHVIRRDYLKDSTVTIHLIGTNSSENSWLNQNYIKRELQGSLYNSSTNTKNGILGVVLPDAVDSIYKGFHDCSVCGGSHNTVNINDDTVVKEFSYNYYIPKSNGCAWGEDDRYCVLVKWSDFIQQPNKYINQAFDNRVGDERLIPSPTSHTTVRTVPYTAVQFYMTCFV